MTNVPRPKETDLVEVKNALLTYEIRAYKMAARYLLAAVFLVLLYLVLVALKKIEQPTLPFVLMAIFAAACLALPLLNKVSFSKDGGSFERADLIAQIDAMEGKAQAARTESFEQTRQQISALSAEMRELKENFLRETADRQQSESNFRPSDEEPTLSQVRKLLGVVSDKSDFQKGRFGGSSSNGNRVLTAQVLTSEIGKKWQKIVFKLSSTDGKPLTGQFAHFFMHDSFDPDAYRVKIKPGATEVEFETASVGAFTAGVVADRGETKLEIDLASSSIDAPDWWKRI